jgi:hypothetical protein
MIRERSEMKSFVEEENRNNLEGWLPEKPSKTVRRIQYLQRKYDSEPTRIRLHDFY